MQEDEDEEEIDGKVNLCNVYCLFFRGGYMLSCVVILERESKIVMKIVMKMEMKMEMKKK